MSTNNCQTGRDMARRFATVSSLLAAAIGSALHPVGGAPVCRWTITANCCQSIVESVAARRARIRQVVKDAKSQAEKKSF
jgi:hypothetical protein